MTIFQPRIGNISTYEMSRDELLDWANNFLAPKAKLAFEGKGEFVPGEHCRFCKAKVKCTARALENLKLAAYEFKTADLLTDEEIEEYTRGCISAYILSKKAGESLSMKDMKPLMNIVKEKYPSANGKIISKVLGSLIKK